MADDFRSEIIASVCDARDEVVFGWRSFEAYPLLVTLAGAQPVPVPLTSDEAHDLRAMAAALTPRTRLELLRTPYPSAAELASCRAVLRTLGALGNTPVQLAAARRRLDLPA